MDKFSWIFILLGILLVSNFAHKVSAASTETSAVDDLYPDDGDEGEEDEIPAGVVPKITSPPQELIVDEGRKVELPCFGENTKWFATLWKKGDAYLANNEITVTTDKRISVTVKDDRNTLIIENLNSGDNGEYKCVIYEGSKVITSVTHKVMVKEMPRVFTIPTKVVKANEPATIVCNTTGFPVPEVYWERKGKRMPNGDAVTKGSSVTFASVNRHHAGTYECFANNSLGTARTAMAFHVMHAPEIEMERESVNSGLSAEAELVCFVHAEPKAQVAWLKDGRPISQSTQHKHHIVQKSSHHWTLHIMNVNQEDFGKYVCMANNSLGRDSKVIELSGSPSQPVYKSGSVGTDGTSYTLEWTFDSAVNIDSVKLRYRKAGSEWKELDVPAEPSQQPNLYTVSYVLTDLTPSSDYEATLMAQNSFGWSRESTVRSFHLNGEFQSLEPDDGMKTKESMSSSMSWRSCWSLLALSVTLPILRWSPQ